MPQWPLGHEIAVSGADSASRGISRAPSSASGSRMDSFTTSLPECSASNLKPTFLPSLSSYARVIRPKSGCLGNPQISRPPTMAFIAAPGFLGVSLQTTRCRKIRALGSVIAAMGPPSAGRSSWGFPLGVTKVLYHVSQYSPPQSVSVKLLNQILTTALPPTRMGTYCSSANSAHIFSASTKPWIKTSVDSRRSGSLFVKPIESTKPSVALSYFRNHGSAKRVAAAAMASGGVETTQAQAARFKPNRLEQKMALSQNGLSQA
mmetsp:Transcript_53357/g.159236  ORF Transcript_53357/g.159236 Transcript_53357/m.159236 type:complete len:262 (+) Transcript_53357:519-1304(+)